MGQFYKRSVITVFWAAFCAHLPSSPKESSAVVWGSAQDTQMFQIVVCFCHKGKASSSKGSPGEEQAVFPRPADEGKTAVENKGAFPNQVHFKTGVSNTGYSVHIFLLVMWCLPCVGPLECSHKSV